MPFPHLVTLPVQGVLQKAARYSNDVVDLHLRHTAPWPVALSTMSCSLRLALMTLTGMSFDRPSRACLFSHVGSLAAAPSKVCTSLLRTALPTASAHLTALISRSGSCPTSAAHPARSSAILLPRKLTAGTFKTKASSMLKWDVIF